MVGSDAAFHRLPAGRDMDGSSHRFWVESEKRFVTLRVSAKGMRVIDKKGIDTVLSELRARGEKY